ncbi:MAG TPA: hypothetical protein VMZ03_12090 [Chitinophagaceae bacterium]|nr:hypothetical protein [Chitinophagaceae bacterium]
MIRFVVILLSLLAGIAVYAFFQRGLIRNYLPDILWALSLCQAAILMYEKNFHPAFVGVLLLLPFLMETGQLGLFPGTFDAYDLLLYGGLYIAFFHPQIIFLCKRISKVLSDA